MSTYRVTLQIDSATLEVDVEVDSDATPSEPELQELAEDALIAQIEQSKLDCYEKIS